MDRPEIHVTREGDLLVPCSEFDVEMIRRHPQGTVMGIVLHEPRSVPQHRLYWAVLRAIHEATGFHPTLRALHDDIKDALGWPGVPTRFELMPAEDWREFQRAAFFLLQEQVLGHLTIEQILEKGSKTLSQEEREALDHD